MILQEHGTSLVVGAHAQPIVGIGLLGSEVGRDSRIFGGLDHVPGELGRLGVVGTTHDCVLDGIRYDVRHDSFGCEG